MALVCKPLRALALSTGAVCPLVRLDTNSRGAPVRWMDSLFKHGDHITSKNELSLSTSHDST